MLKILKVPHRAALTSLIKDFDPKAATWVVSDLRSKFELQQRLLERDNGYLDTSILRASDLWKILLKRALPNLRLVSRDFARSLVRHFLDQHRESIRGELGLEGLSENFLMSLMDRFAGIAFHPEGDRLMNEWFQQNEESAKRWQSRFAVARLALRYMDSQNMVVAKWASSILQRLPDEHRSWELPLIVDLGAELTSAEASLFLDLSKHVDVTLIEPSPSWISKDEFLLRPYRDLEGFASKVEKIPVSLPEPGRREVRRFSGQLAETKEAVARARAWVGAGVPLDRVAILAPEIEDYWPVLKSYLDEEGLPADKPVAVKLNALPSVNRWLARLRPRKGELRPTDLELAYYSYESERHLRHEEFRSLFANLYGEEDLSRHESVRLFFEKRVAGSTGLFPRDAFLEAAVGFWDQLDNLDAFELMAREVLQNASPATTFPLSDWIRYIEAIAASKEMTLSPAEPGGLFVGNFASAHTHPATHRIFLGLSEEGLRKAERNPLPMKDIRELSKMGFHLDHPDQSLLEFELKWLCDGAAAEDLLSVGISSFDGAIRAPSALWMRFFQESHPGESAEHVQLPELTRWDLLQAQDEGAWETERSWESGKKERLMKRLRLDLGEEEPAPLLGQELQKLSPSTVKTYLDCPFRVASARLFRLQDLSEVDVDVARSEGGNLSHAIFQKLTDGGWVERPEVSDEELKELIELARQEVELNFAEEKLWDPFLRKQVRVAREFLRVEKEWKKLFPMSQVLRSEAPWKIWFDPASGEFSLSEQASAIELQGRIDRLETDGQGRYVVIDYKASQSGLHHHTAWLNENEIQLLFYMWALEKGAIEDAKGQAIGAFYYVYKNFRRDIGFQIDSEAGRLFPEAGRKKNLKADEAEKLELFQELETRIKSVVERSRAGDWAPKPFADNKNGLCERCNWNGLCRAPHLN